MTWVLIGVVLLVAFGPVLWLVPSKKDRRLTALRGRARTEGLVVEIRRIPKPNPSAQERVTAGGRIKAPVIECATYGHPLRQKLGYLPTWRVVRVTDEEAPDPLPGWRYDQRPKGDGRRYLDQMLEPAAALLDALPEDVAALEIGPRMVLVYWLEKPGSREEDVARIAGYLRDFDRSLEALEDQISDNLDINDS